MSFFGELFQKIESKSKI